MYRKTEPRAPLNSHPLFKFPDVGCCCCSFFSTAASAISNKEHCPTSSLRWQTHNVFRCPLPSLPHPTPKMTTVRRATKTSLLLRQPCRRGHGQPPTSAVTTTWLHRPHRRLGTGMPLLAFAEEPHPCGAQGDKRQGSHLVRVGAAPLARACQRCLPDNTCGFLLFVPSGKTDPCFRLAPLQECDAAWRI